MNIYELTDLELLNIIIGNNKDNECIKEALAEYSCMPKMILQHSEEDLLKIKGVGKATVQKIDALKEIINRVNNYNVKKIKIISNPKNVYDIFKCEMQHLEQEVLKLICLNTKNHILLIQDVFKGTLDSSIVHPREIFKIALRCNAKRIILIHNHPSGNPEASEQDCEITLRIKECGDFMGIQLTDHIIIGCNKYVSLKEKGII